jgi:hypothetical protein
MNEKDKVKEAKRIYHKKKREENKDRYKEYERRFYLKKYEEYKQEGEL